MLIIESERPKKNLMANINYLSEKYGVIETQFAFDTLSELDEQIKIGPGFECIQSVTIVKYGLYPKTLEEL